MVKENRGPYADSPAPPPGFFTFTGGGRARHELEPLLVEAMDCRKKLAGLDKDLAAVAARIMMMGGVIVPYAKLSELRAQHQQLSEAFKSALSRILETGFPVQYHELGMLSFPSL